MVPVRVRLTGLSRPRPAAAAVLFLALAGCQSFQIAPPPPKAPDPPAAPSPPVAADYAVCFPDVLELEVAGRPDATGARLVYPDGRSAFTLYEDDGSTGAYRRGGFALTEIGCEASDEGIVCRVAAPRGDGAGLVPEGRTYSFRVRVPAAPRSVEVEGVAQPDWSHDGRHFLRVDVTGHPVEVRIRR